MLAHLILQAFGLDSLNAFGVDVPGRGTFRIRQSLGLFVGFSGRACRCPRRGARRSGGRCGRRRRAIGAPSGPPCTRPLAMRPRPRGSGRLLDSGVSDLLLFWQRFNFQHRRDCPVVGSAQRSTSRWFARRQRARVGGRLRQCGRGRTRIGILHAVLSPVPHAPDDGRAERAKE